MILDSTTEFCDAVAVAAAAGTALLGSQIDLGVTGSGDADELYLVITVDTDIVTAGVAGTIQFAVASDSTASVSTTTATKHLLTPAFVTGASGLPAGTILFVGELPQGGGTINDYERFLGLLCITGTTATTAGKINAFLTVDGAGWKALANAAGA